MEGSLPKLKQELGTVSVPGKGTACHIVVPSIQNNDFGYIYKRKEKACINALKTAGVQLHSLWIAETDKMVFWIILSD